MRKVAVLLSILQAILFSKLLEWIFIKYGTRGSTSQVRKKKLIVIYSGPVLTHPCIRLYSLSLTLQHKNWYSVSKNIFQGGNLTKEKSSIQWDLPYGDSGVHHKLKIKPNDFLMTV
jgi:hypothetical protein